MFAEQAQQLIAEYEQRRVKAADLRRKVNEIQGTATAPRNAIKVTVGVQGDVSAVEFPTGAYKRMAPKELADALLATIAEARQDAMTAFTELMAPEMPAGLDFGRLLQARGDLSVAAPTEADIPGAVREHLGGGRPAAPAPAPNGGHHER
jgi:DNA-binding protein YbaB